MQKMMDAVKHLSINVFFSKFNFSCKCGTTHLHFGAALFPQIFIMLAQQLERTNSKTASMASWIRASDIVSYGDGVREVGGWNPGHGIIVEGVFHPTMQLVRFFPPNMPFIVHFKLG